MSKSAQSDGIAESVQLSITEVGVDETKRRLKERVRESTVDDRDRALAALGELRQLTVDYDLAEDADACGRVGCPATEQLVKTDGRVLCRSCAAEYHRKR